MWRAVGLVLLSTPALAESLVAARTLPARTVIAQEDVMLVDAQIEGALTTAEDALGQETRVAIYAGRPLRAQDIGSATLVERNATVTLIYRVGGLTILAEGRALSQGAEGEVIRVMNLSSKTTVQGQIGPDGFVTVGGTR